MDADDYRAVFDAMGDALALLGRTPGEPFQIFDVNRAWERLFGRARAEYLTRPLERVFTNNLALEIYDACERCIGSGDTLELRMNILTATGASTQVWKLAPIREANGRVNRIVLIARATPAEAVTSLPDGRFHTILEQTSDTVAYFDRHARILYFNAPGLRTFNLVHLDVIGKTVVELWPDSPNALMYHRAVLHTVRTRELQEAEFWIDEFNGRRIWFQARLAPERNAEGDVISVIAVGRDITSLKLAEQKLRQSEQQFRTLAEHSPDCILRYDLDTRMIYANPTLERYTGVPVREFIGTKIGEIGKRRDLRHSEEVSSPMREAVLRVLREGRPVELELGERNPYLHTGTSYMSYVVVPERDADGKIESVLAIGRDVGQLKAIEADLRALNATLEQRVAARTSDLELANRDLKSFAHTASHDLRAPLRAIISFATMIGETEGDKLSGQSSALLQRISTAGLKLNRLIDDILQYSHAGQAELSRRPVALDQLAQEVAAELHVQYPSATVSVAELPRVSGDSTMLRQVLQNLIGNALKFSAKQSQPRVEVNWLRQNEEIVFYVRDNGAGFDMRYADKLGAMFQRLHHEREFPGSGVGLAIVHRLIERHGGRLWAKSEAGAGATFFFTVPGSVPEETSGSG